MTDEEAIKNRWLELDQLKNRIREMTTIGAVRDANTVRHMILDYLRYHGWKVSGRTGLLMLTLLLFEQAIQTERNMLSQVIVNSLKSPRSEP